MEKTFQKIEKVNSRGREASQRTKSAKATTQNEVHSIGTFNFCFRVHNESCFLWKFSKNWLKNSWFKFLPHVWHHYMIWKKCMISTCFKSSFSCHKQLLATPVWAEVVYCFKHCTALSTAVTSVDWNIAWKILAMKHFGKGDTVESEALLCLILQSPIIRKSYLVIKFSD